MIITYAWTLCTQICHFLDVSGKVLSLICFANDPCTLYNQLNASRLTPYRKTWKHVNRGKTQCWAHFLISTATFRKTAIKLKFDDRFSLNKISVLQSINRGGESPVCWLLTYINLKMKWLSWDPRIQFLWKLIGVCMCLRSTPFIEAR